MCNKNRKSLNGRYGKITVFDKESFCDAEYIKLNYLQKAQLRYYSYYIKLSGYYYIKLSGYYYIKLSGYYYAKLSGYYYIKLSGYYYAKLSGYFSGVTKFILT